MKTPKISDILGIINKIAPLVLAESWDNCGLQVGNPASDVSRIMVALDPTPAVIESALDNACQLLVTHHPLIFKPQKSISTTTPQGKMIHDAIRGGLAVISMHTNFDIADNGLNDLLAERLELVACKPLQITMQQELVKLVVFVPESHHEQVRVALFPFAESLGAYRDCSFTAAGEGTFTPQNGASPFLGTVGINEKVTEHRLEFLVDRTRLARVLKHLVSVHPYEEPAFDIYPLHNKGKSLGLGRIGKLTDACTLKVFAGHIAERLNSPCLRIVGDPSKKITKVALCSGSGASLLREAVRCGADVLVTGDVKYHEARDAEDLGIALIDAGHFPTEIIMAEDVRNRLLRNLAEEGFKNCEILACRLEHDPFQTLVTMK